MRRHDPIPALTVELAPVYRCGDGRRYLTRDAAYVKAAGHAFWEAYNQYDEVPYDHSPEIPGSSEHWKRVVPRLARWLRWRDGRRAAMGLS